MDVGKPSLDQLATFLAVVEQGGFGAAARKQGRAVSAISYAIAGLEAQLGVTLFARAGSRRPALTEAGRAILAHARSVTSEVDDLVAGVRALNQGVESELGLAVDVMCPAATVAGVLHHFQQAFPTVELRLFVEGLGGTAALVLEGKADLAITGPDIADQPLLHFAAMGGVDLVPVAAASHPLARMAAIAPGMAGRYRQLVLTDRSPLTQGRDFSVLAARTWRLGDLGAKHALLVAGAGWGNMPLHMVQGDLTAGRLVHLALPEGRAQRYPLRAAWRKDCPAGQARKWLLAGLTKALASPVRAELAHTGAGGG
jgi:DNA-binding transcriptional LysR family regulator